MLPLWKSHIFYLKTPLAAPQNCSLVKFPFWKDLCVAASQAASDCRSVTWACWSLLRGVSFHSLRKPEPFYKHFLPLIHQCRPGRRNGWSSSCCAGLAASGSSGVVTPLSCAATAAWLDVQSILNTPRTATPAVRAGGLAHGPPLATLPLTARETIHRGSLFLFSIRGKTLYIDFL